MVKKIEISEIHSKLNGYSKNLKTHKHTKKYKKIKNQPERDTYEKNLSNRYKSEVSNLKFKYHEVVFHPEDVKKMETMSLEEKNAYMLKLKKEGKYKLKEN